MPELNQVKLSKATIRMYKLGTGDCFTIKFYSGNKITFRMIIDCGCWRRKDEEIKPFVKKMLKYMGKKIDVLVVTHEHLDHVLGFEIGKDLFKKVEFGEIWMGWTEKGGDPKVEKWRQKYGEKKRALGVAAKEIKNYLANSSIVKDHETSRDSDKIIGLHNHFKEVMEGFSDLHVSGIDHVKPGLEGLRIVKEEIADKNIEYFHPGRILKNIQGLPGVRIYVLGPPELYEVVKKERGGPEETYDHNKDIDLDDLLLQAFGNNSASNTLTHNISPFDQRYILDHTTTDNESKKRYEDTSEAWRKIDFDWMFSAGSFALRMNSLTNNLSLALAIEFVESGKVLLFPGDAEFGSWQSWHDINWKDQGVDVETKDLLEQTVFYKVAHHLSHNGTAKRLGLNLMNHPELAAMATLDHEIISKGWKSTMPNRLIIKDLLRKTKGKLMIMNTDKLFYDFEEKIPLAGKIEEAQNALDDNEKALFEKDFKDTDDYLEYTIHI